MSLERIQHLISRFRTEVAAAAPAPRERRLEPALWRELIESMLLARHLDLAAHELRKSGDGHYTICSSGHEANAVLGRLTHSTDPSLLHYRSAALQLERARQVPGVDAVRDIALSLVASSEEPVSGGRHKVFGRRELGIIPSTSTIASHLPRAVGLAFAIERVARLEPARRLPPDAIALVSFGDASLNHSTALGALNAASWVVHQRLTLPLLFVCEDNGLGISVRTPEGWVEQRLRALPHIAYFACRAWDLEQSHEVAAHAVEYCRKQRRPAVLHLSCERLLGHAGSDVDTVYRTPAEISAAEARDPVLCAALQAIASRALSADQLLDLDRACRERVLGEAERARTRPKLQSRAAVMSALATPVSFEPASNHPTSAEPGTLAQGINGALVEALERFRETLIFGEDVAKKGGVYGLTKGLLAKAGPARVFNTLLDEQTILGIALGTATLGLLPVPEIQYLAYLHNAEDQLRGEALSMQFFSDRAYDNPMVVRVAGLAYQKGFGGHFHNDNSLAVLRDIPGLILAIPARRDDAAELYRSAFRIASEARRVVVVVEPIALYHTRDLHDAGDGAWCAPLPPGEAAFGRARIYHPEARDLLIMSYANGLHMSLRVARQMERDSGSSVRVLDLRWLAPLPRADILEHARSVGRVLMVDECRQSGSAAEAVASMIACEAPEVRYAQVCAADSYIPLGDAAKLVLVSEQEISDAAYRLVNDRNREMPGARPRPLTKPPA